MLIEQERNEAEANTVDPDAVSHTEPPVREFEDASTWTGIAIANLLQPSEVMTQPTDDESIYEGQVFGLKGEVIHSVKTFSRCHQQYYICKSTKTLLKLKCKHGWSLHRVSVLYNVGLMRCWR